MGVATKWDGQLAEKEEGSKASMASIAVGRSLDLEHDDDYDYDYDPDDDTLTCPTHHGTMSDREKEDRRECQLGNRAAC